MNLCRSIFQDCRILGLKRRMSLTKIVFSDFDDTMSLSASQYYYSAIGAALVWHSFQYSSMAAILTKHHHYREVTRYSSIMNLNPSMQSCS